MKVKIFICHRPYHILRCCDMINRDKNIECKNILFTFDVRLDNSDDYQRFETQSIFYSYFDEVNELSRTPVPSVRSILDMYRFCRARRSEYMNYVNKYKVIDSIIFFADDELEVQLLVGLFREKNKNQFQCILVDEGLVTYSALDHAPSWRRRLWLGVFKVFAGIKFFNTEQTYGFSNLYNLSLANNPEKAIYFHKPIKFLSPLSEETCSQIREKISSKKVPDYSRPYFIYINTYEKSFQDDLPVIMKMRSILQKYDVKFYLKLHPQQNEELYKKQLGESVMLEKGIPVELFFGKNAIMAGTISSALFNASLQGYNNVLDISKLFPENIRRSWFQIPICEQFDWIKIIEVDSLEQFDSVIYRFVKS